MKKRKVIDRMKSLDKGELNAFGKTLKPESPEYKLFSYLRKFHPAFDHKSLENDKKAIAMVFKNAETNVQKAIADKSSDLKLLIEKFMRATTVESSKFEQHKLLAKRFEQKGEQEQAIAYFRKALESLPKEKGFLENSEALHIYRTIYLSPFQNKFKDEAVHLLDMIYETGEHAHQLISKFISIEQKQRKLILGSTNEPKELPSHPLVDLLTKIETLFDRPDIDLFQQIKQTLKDNPFPLEMDTIFTWLLNFLFNQIGESVDDNMDWKKETLALHQAGIDKGFILTNGVLSPNHFDNAIMLSCELGDIKGSRSLAEKGDALLSCENKSFHINFANARIAFSEGNYEEVLSLLQRVKFKNISNDLKARTLLTKTYCELWFTSQSKNLRSPLDSLEELRSFLNRNKKIKDKRKKPYENFIKKTKQLIKHINNKDKICELLKEVNALKRNQINNKDWLLGKIRAAGTTK